MDVLDLWAEIVAWLSRHAPVTAAALRPPVEGSEVAAIEAELAVELPEELRQWWSCCGGTDHDVLADILPPFYTPYSASGARQAWRAHRESWSSQWERPACDYYAGSAGNSYHPAWIPIAGDGFADELLVDLRPGSLRGCVLEWEQETGKVHRPQWSSVAAMLTEVHRSLIESVPAGHSRPTVTEDGRLDWQIS